MLLQTCKAFSSIMYEKFTFLAGFGIASLLWMNEYEAEKFKTYSFCGTIADYVVYLLCGNHCMSTQNTTSWGYFDADDSNWDMKK